jgi:hypothetical protein
MSEQYEELFVAPAHGSTPAQKFVSVYEPA